MMSLFSHGTLVRALTHIKLVREDSCYAKVYEVIHLCIISYTSYDEWKLLFKSKLRFSG